MQKVAGLKHLDTYRLSGKVRSSWPVDMEHYCQVGYDPTGQDSDPKASTIVWQALPGAAQHLGQLQQRADSPGQGFDQRLAARLGQIDRGHAVQGGFR